jgi:hypothetical protein
VSEKLPEWPSRLTLIGTDVNGYLNQVMDYDQKLIAAYRARLRVAVEALKEARLEIKEHCGCLGSGDWEIEKALAAIGPLSEEN